MSGSVSRISLDEAQSIPDILSNDNFRLMIGSIPNSSGGTSTTLEIKCQQALISGRQNQVYNAVLGGFVRNFRGQNRFTQAQGLAISYVEDITMDTFKQLRSWMEGLFGTNSGTSIGNVSDYSVSAELYVFDQAGNIIDVHTMQNFFVINTTEIQFEVSQSQPVIIQAEFVFDWTSSNTITLR